MVVHLGTSHLDLHYGHSYFAQACSGQSTLQFMGSHFVSHKEFYIFSHWFVHFGSSQIGSQIAI